MVARGARESGGTIGRVYDDLQDLLRTRYSKDLADPQERERLLPAKSTFYKRMAELGLSDVVRASTRRRAVIPFQGAPLNVEESTADAYADIGPVDLDSVTAYPPLPVPGREVDHPPSGPVLAGAEENAAAAERGDPYAGIGHIDLDAITLDSPPSAPGPHAVPLPRPDPVPGPTSPAESPGTDRPAAEEAPAPDEDASWTGRPPSAGVGEVPHIAAVAPLSQRAASRTPCLAA